MNEAQPTLLHIVSIFKGIKAGHHWCFGDPEYPDLNGEQFEEYKAFFAQLGLSLHRDGRGFVFATSDDDDYKGSEMITKFVVFTAVWVDALADAGKNIVQSLFVPHQYVDDLPHLLSETHRRMLTQVNINSESDLQNTLRSLERLGFLSLDGQGRFTLRESYHRLLDVCLNSRAKNPEYEHISEHQNLQKIESEKEEGL